MEPQTPNRKYYNETESQELKNELMSRWTRLESTPGVFRYKLNVQKQKVLPGDYKFVVQLNSERTAIRRAAQPIESIRPEFDATAFNFNKVKNEEILLNYNIRDMKAPITLIVNTSPLTKYHTLVCPDMERNLPQILTPAALCAAIELLADLDDRNFRIGYNSPGALASVNHLHMHLLYIEQRMHVDHTILRYSKCNILTSYTHLIEDVFKLGGPIQGYFVTVVDWSRRVKAEMVRTVMKIVKFFLSENIPHNLFFNYVRTEEREVVHIFIFPRSQMCDSKDFSCLNVACCELAGFVNTGGEDIYDGLSEESILEKIRNEIGVIPNLDEKLIALFTK